MKKISLFVFTLLFFIYEELVFHISIYDNYDNLKYIVLFSVLISLFIYLITQLFNKKINKIIYYIIIIIYIALFIAQFVYYQFYDSFISVYSIFYGGQAFAFINTIMEIVKANISVLGFIILPLPILIILTSSKIIVFEKIDWKEKISNLILYTMFHFIIVFSITCFDMNELYSNNTLYFKPNSMSMTAYKFGLTTTMRLDIQRFALKIETTELNQTVVFKPKETIYEPNKINIDFQSLIENEKNPKVKQLHEYFSNSSASNKNEYTGMFEGKNLISFVAESFYDLAVNPTLTPNLYKLLKEGFQFNNFYVPLFLSTVDGEYITYTSLLPKENIWTLQNIVGHYIPYSYANAFENLGYSSNAYHDGAYTYYKRYKTMPALGYDNFKACGSGLEKKMTCRTWPAINSDYEMMTATMDDYIKDDKFIVNYMTVSGHLQYTKSKHIIASNNYEQVKDLPYSSKVKYYLAANIELDKAIGETIRKLEEEGRLDDTVIVLSSDHFPYGLNLDEINEMTEIDRDPVFERNRSSLIIWNSEIKEPIVINKYASNLDILPTILNLFGIEYDSRLLMGTDILSNSEPLIIFSNRSFITNKGKYNNLTDEFQAFDPNEIITKEYIDNIKSIISNKFNVSKLIFDTNYYNYLKDELVKKEVNQNEL